MSMLHRPTDSVNARSDRRAARRRRLSAPKRRGTAIVELAVILPLLFTIMLGCVDFGRYAYAYIAMLNAVREGAAYGAGHPATPDTQAEWKQEIREIIATEMGSWGDFELNKLQTPPPETITDGVGQYSVQVEASHPFETIIPWPFIPNAFTLEASAQMRYIR